MKNDVLLKCNCLINRLRKNTSSISQNEETIFIETNTYYESYGSGYSSRFVCLNCGGQCELSRYSDKPKYVIDVEFLSLTNDHLRMLVNKELEFIKDFPEFELTQDKIKFSYLCLYFIFDAYYNVLTNPLIRFDYIRYLIIVCVNSFFEHTVDIKKVEISECKEEIAKLIKLHVGSQSDSKEIVIPLKRFDFSYFTDQKKYGPLAIEKVYNTDECPIRNFKYKVDEYFKKKDFVEKEKNIKKEIFSLQRKLIKTAINLLEKGGTKVEQYSKRISIKTYDM